MDTTEQNFRDRLKTLWLVYETEGRGALKAAILARITDLQNRVIHLEQFRKARALRLQSGS